MRIFDLLNDGDAAAALLASASGESPAPGMKKQPSSSYQWRNPAAENDSEDPVHAFPAFLLNDNKPWKTKTQKPASAAASDVVKKVGAKATQPHEHKTMSIFDIVATNPRSLLLHPQPNTSTTCCKKPVAPVENTLELESPACNKRAFARIDALEHRAATPKRVRMTVPMPVAVPPPHPPEPEEVQEETEVATDSQAQKRQRQRVLFRRNYYKRMNTIAEMRDVRAELEEEYEQLMWKRNAEQMVQTYLRKGKAKDSSEEIREAYMDLCRAKDLLRTENSAIEKVLQDVRKVDDKMRWLVDAEGGLRADDHIDLTQCPTACQGADPLLAAEATELSQQCRDLILRHVLPSGARSSAALPSAFGWEVHRQQFMANRVLVAEKVATQARPAALAGMMWQWVSHANECDTLRTIAGRAVLRQCYVVQRVSAAHLVLYLALDGDRHALCLVSRTSIGANDQDTIVTVQALPAPCAASGHWLEDLMGWIRFTAEGRDSTRVSLGASLPAGAAHQEEHWLRLLVVASMELETQLFGAQTPRVLAA